ncbi:23S rRNA pseudouridine2605 synthase [Zhouia amylolytica]|uniref:Pseudouridine synthase n=2 Tax=Zhouia amylolytica TaxID=376730 RepID=W2UIS2_9FLAO|nr:pseudouridine synthase [Zhouia amylolytica]ETN93824.1 rRNA pseudouridylate synthase B [Zhouia amylolytica AD3]MCQ0111730.1 rRNA pseudouridine synthase [Zhouia amylolytica]SFS34601.1 23S rRNA pseudouridine2605 synthase [Zhouia amylolytica]
MSRKDNSNKGKSHGRQGGDNRKPSGRGGTRKQSFARGNAPIKKAPLLKNKQDDGKIRLNKYIANSGVCSRRDADIYITSGNVLVNGQVVTELGYKVNLTDEVKFDGKTINPEKKEYVLLNKPKGFITTTNDERGRRTVMDLVRNSTKSRIVPVGRLDRNTTGLLLFTNDGALAKKLTHPKHGIRKIYHVKLNRNLVYDDLKAIANGLKLEDGLIEVDEVSYIENASKSEVGIKIHSGRNRIVRRIFEHLGYEVVKLDRVVFAGLTKKDLPRGTWRKLNEQEINNLKML